MEIWRLYLEQLADREGDAEGQIVAAAYRAADVFGILSLTLDQDGKARELIEQRIGYFRDGSRRAEQFGDMLVTACFTLYNHLNTLCRQFASGSAESESLLRQIEQQVQARTRTGDQIERSSAALRAVFPMISLMTLILDQDEAMSQTIRQIEQRFSSGAGRATTSWEHLLNALYRTVEIMQLFVLLSDPDLKNQVHQIAVEFEEEDKQVDLKMKLRNGFCRLFELGHLVTAHLDDILDPGGTR